MKIKRYLRHFCSYKKKSLKKSISTIKLKTIAESYSNKRYLYISLKVWLNLFQYEQI